MSKRTYQPNNRRLPPAHAHPRRPRHPVLAAGQGPQAPLRLIRWTSRPSRGPVGAEPDVLAKAHRLTGAEDFSSTIRTGGRKGSATLVAHLRLATEPSPPRVGLVVSRAVGGAVTRKAGSAVNS